MSIKAKIGIFAPQGMNGVTIIVSSRCFWCSIVRVLMIAGTVQPVPMTSGMIDFPERPIERIWRSMMNAIRAM